MNASPSDESPDPVRERDLTGHELGGYTLLRRLGRGGMAIVYLAMQTSLNRNVALKILKPDLARDQTYVQRFHREAQAAAGLVQSNIVQIYEVGEAEGYHFIAQEYVQGRNLKQYLSRNGAVEPVMAVNILSQCARALLKAGEQHVIHRDIKPENIMLSSKGEIKVTDFGLARINNDESGQALTKVGITMGTPLYMSPEQVEGRQVDARSDIYSLGVTAYHMLAGQPPFDGENPLAIAVRQVKDQAAPLKNLRQDVPPELCDIIHRMIRKDPLHRPQDAAELLKDLRSVKVDFDNDWEKLLERLAVAEPLDDRASAIPEHSQLEVTRQLQAAMKGNLQSVAVMRSRRAWLAALSLIGLVAGGWLAAANPLPDPLGTIEVATNNNIPREQTVEEQLDAAYWSAYSLRRKNDATKKEQYWRAVMDYFPVEQADTDKHNKTELVHRRARTRLGEHYLTENELRKARKVFEQLTEHEERRTSHFSLMGLAGQAIVFDQMSASEFEGEAIEQKRRVLDCLSELVGRSDRLNAFMRERVEDLFQRYDAGTLKDPT